MQVRQTSFIDSFLFPTVMDHFFSKGVSIIKSYSILIFQLILPRNHFRSNIFQLEKNQNSKSIIFYFR